MEMLDVQFSCLPGMEDDLIAPAPARQHIPDWLRDMPNEAATDFTGGHALRTLKQCPPFLDVMQAGFLFFLQADITIEDGWVRWDEGVPAVEGSSHPRSPVALHAVEQLKDSPLDQGQMALKFLNFFTIAMPPGWFALFTHPHNRAELPFQTLSGMVDAHHFAHGLVHFPAMLAGDFEGVIPKGTPVAQMVPVPGAQLKPSAHVGAMTEDEFRRHLEVSQDLRDEPGAYRKSFRLVPSQA